ncbi:MAG: type II CAAX endopeptidase family protein [Deltaproteobacteria bacterium]|nr:type II CAAX endopeptidase family protein [Deltaproteobacteria bacterium]
MSDQSVPTVSRGLPIAIVRGVLFFLGTAILSRQLLGEEANPFDGSTPALLLIAGLLTVDAVGTNLALWKVGRQNPRTLGWPSALGSPNLARDIVLGILGFGVCALWITLVMFAVGGLEAVNEVAGGIADFTLRQRLCFFAIGIFGACVAEESLYRGYLQPAMVQKLGVVGGILLTSLLFSLLHFNFNPISIVSKFLLGATYGVLAWRTGSLVAPGVTHALVWFVIGAS